MASIGNLRLLSQAFKNDLLRNRFLSNQAFTGKLYPSIPAKSSFISWNRPECNLTYKYFSAPFHHLAESILNNNVTYSMNIGTWTAATEKQIPISRSRMKINYADIQWPIEKILNERKKMMRNDRVFAKSTDTPKLYGLDMKEFHYTHLPAEKVLKETQLKKQNLKKSQKEKQVSERC